MRKFDLLARPSKTTKGAIQFKTHVDPDKHSDDLDPMQTFYLKKWAFKGGSPPAQIRITVEIPEAD